MGLACSRRSFQKAVKLQLAKKLVSQRDAFPMSGFIDQIWGWEIHTPLGTAWIADGGMVVIRCRRSPALGGDPGACRPLPPSRPAIRPPFPVNERKQQQRWVIAALGLIMGLVLFNESGVAISLADRRDNPDQQEDAIGGLSTMGDRSRPSC